MNYIDPSKNKSFWKTYGIFQIIWLFTCFILTRLLFKSCHLIRFPIFLRYKSNIIFGKGFVCGYLVRMDAFGPIGSITFGSNVQLNDFVHIGAVESVSVGNNVLIASRVFISDHDHGHYNDEHEPCRPSQPPAERIIYSKPVIIENNVWIGENVSILPGTRIGEGSIIGAGSVVKGIIPPYSIAVGVPAKVIKRFNSDLNRWIAVTRI